MSTFLIFFHVPSPGEQRGLRAQGPTHSFTDEGQGGTQVVQSQSQGAAPRPVACWETEGLPLHDVKCCKTLEVRSVCIMLFRSPQIFKLPISSQLHLAFHIYKLMLWQVLGSHQASDLVNIGVLLSLDWIKILMES